MSVMIFILLILSVCSSQIGDQKSLAVTIYNNQFAMVKDVRSITFQNGTSELYFTDVSSNIQPETVTFKAIDNPELVKVYEQNYQANLINTNAILQKYIQKQIQVYSKLGENSVRVRGILLGFNSGYILKTSTGIEVLNNIDGITFPSLPNGFFTLPTLNWKVFSTSSLVSDCEVAYRTTGFSWKSDYSITLNSDETRADIGGWVTIDNHSGKKYENAKLKLIAGDVKTVQNNPVTRYYATPSAAPGGAMAESAPSFSQKSFSDFHMYTLSQTVTLNDKSQKQVEFIPKVYNIIIRKYNLIKISVGGYNEQNLKASNKIEFKNTKQNGLGIPLPKGTVRVFKADDSDGSLEFVGEDSINHTPKDENITLTTGNAFDITANKYATNRQNFGSNEYSADLNITISNHKDIKAEIVLEINNYYGDNLKINWKTSSVNLNKVSSSLYRVTKVFAPDESFTYVWTENYRP